MAECKRILVINPNSNAQVTRGLSEALEVFRWAGGPEILCETLAEGPFGIESQRDVESVTLPLRHLVEARDDVDAFVIACYSDPGLHVCREATRKPVLGIQASGVLTALSMAERIGVLALSSGSIRRHLRYLRQMGIDLSLVSERALDLTVAETAGGETFAQLNAVGGALRDQDAAGAVILGCAGMARHRAALEDSLGVPVIDPTQAAVTMAIGALLVG